MNRKRIFDELVEIKKRQRTRTIFGKKKNVDEGNIKSSSRDKYSTEELRFLCQKYNRLSQDLVMFE